MSPLSYLEISRDALRHNAQAMRALLEPHQQLIAVVKANAYGHGLAPVVEAVSDLVDGFQVDDMDELRAIRQLTDARVLVLGYVQPNDIAEALTLRGELCVYNPEMLSAFHQPARIHIKVDALLGRQGILPDDFDSFLEAVHANPNLEVAGVYAHFANLEDTESHDHADAQLNLLKSLNLAGLPMHISSSAGIMTYPGEGALVRMGIALYGIYPSPHFATKLAHLQLKPAIRWVSHLAQVKTLPAGHPVSYGLTYITSKPTQVAIVPQGYSDGYDRSLSNKSHVLVRGVACPVLGRIAMNMFTIDVSAVDCQAGDEVILLGEGVKAEKLADAADTIPYEIVARLNPLLPRTLV